jgi:hypothetical protein
MKRRRPRERKGRGGKREFPDENQLRGSRLQINWRRSERRVHVFFSPTPEFI